MTEKRNGVVTLQGNPMTLLGKEINIGDKAPDFNVLTKELKPFTLNNAKSKIKVINVVPSIDTPVCDMQVRRFNQEAANLKDVEILSVSVDLPFALGRYCGAQGIDKVITLSDHKDLSFGLAYGFVIEELRVLSRGIVVIDEKNVVRYIEYVKEVSDHPDYEKAIEAIKSLL